MIVIGLGSSNRYDDNASAAVQDRDDHAPPVLDAFMMTRVPFMLPEKRKLDDVTRFRGARISR